jgi:hypothetical protein
VRRVQDSARRRARLRPSRVGLALVVAIVAAGLGEITQSSPGWADLAPPFTLTAVADATIASGEPNANFGRVGALLADEKPRHESLVRFSVPVGVGGRAVLRLWVLDGTKNGPKVKRYNGTLDEQALTWKTRVTPYVGTSVNTGALKAGTWAEWDVSGLLPAGPGDVTLAVVPDSGDGADFASRESDHSPELVITAAAPPTTSSTTSSTSTSTSSTTTTSTSTTTTTTPDPGTPPACRPDWEEAAPVAKLDSGLSEMSGFVASRNHPGWGWGIRDSGNPASLYAIRPDADGTPRVGELRAYQLRNRDWEDLAYTPGALPGAGHLWVLENVGNSWVGNRWVYQFKEVAPDDLPPPPPPPPPSTTTTTTTTTTTPPGGDVPPESTTTTTTAPPPPTTTTTTVPPPPPPPPPPATLVGAYQWAYPDTQVNTETMFFFDDHLVVVTKTEPSRVYRFDEPLQAGVLNVPSYIGTLPVGKLLSIAALSVDERTLAVASHGKVDVYENRGDVHDLAALISNHVFRQDMASDNREGGSFFPYGSCDLLLTAESKRLWRLEHR